MNNNKKDRFVIGGSIAVFVLIFGWASNEDYEQSILDDAVYIKLVCEGTYPNYKNLKMECGDGQ
tara:strand:- start:4474 stop:4665 length:192 start_codon:yes stop_codon:yes gene_type:complete